MCGQKAKHLSQTLCVSDCRIIGWLANITQTSIGVMDQNYVHHKINGNQNLWVLWDPMFDPQPHDPEVHSYLSSSFPIKIRIKATTL